ncbi:chitin synthase-domain-containing protein [Absidia repens]|uniref:chitin synthase n=1 Tax=Absidia repens TaxID=90262 RepID=A0A1X2I610_9FUNG|nr:chitin synthase-domain-containing protein [Absidia repens]
MTRPTSSYQPALNRQLSFHSTSDNEDSSGDGGALPAISSGGIPYQNDDDDDHGDGAQKQQQQTPKRTKSLVRPERERIDKQHRHYHYRQATKRQVEKSQDADRVAPSTTGHTPVRSIERQSSLRTGDGGGGVVGDTFVPPTAASTAAAATSTNPTGADSSRLLLRRGKSILGREEKQTLAEDEDDDDSDGSSDPYGHEKRTWSDPWFTYCRLITCCFPSQLLRWAGIPDGPAQSAWREKIGLCSMILLVMGFVGFLTFGFTITVCGIPPLSVHGGEVSDGYMVIHGWAYMLADWNGHPTIPGVTEGSDTNVLYPPLNGGGMDASFLFQTQIDTSACKNVLTNKQGDQSVYFPCQLFNPNATTPPPPSQFSNQTSCHLSSAATQQFNTFDQQGVPKKNEGGGVNKAARVYYDWTDLNQDNQYMAYNGDVLNLKLLQSLPTDYFGVLQGGLIEAIANNVSEFAGKDMTSTIMGYRLADNRWEEEATCLQSLIKVGSIDTFSVGCIASDIVLYISLVVILAVILVKFFLAVVFGWFLSWKLGHFDEDKDYAARMKRQEEIENWTRNMDASAPFNALRPTNPYINKKQRRKTLLPQTSRYTQPEHGVHHYDTTVSLGGGSPSSASVAALANNNNSSTWNPTAPNAPFMSRASMISLPSGFGSNRPNSAFFGGASSPRLSYYETNNNNGHRLSALSTPRLSTTSLSLSSGESNNSNGMPKCPLPVSPFANPQPPADYMPFNFVLAPTRLPQLTQAPLGDLRWYYHWLWNSKSTPEICVDMMRDLIVPADQVQAFPYIAIADGQKKNNMAKVYAGFYKFNDATVDPSLQQRVPMITLVKCGTTEEANTAAKPGNRGKRDSQMMLMQFMQKVMFDERMTRMEYELFNSFWQISNLPADAFELCLMVDADTKLYPDALSRLVSCAVKDPSISGLCGETKIANKRDSWVTMIQVFEYYISHHQSKAFESVFGCVTCLPGCFCMYRIKAPKGPNGYWVPILANPDIVERYSENVVDTLHKKNLLLLGEDRYLSTLMLKTFPHRKMMFVPQAVCKTVVPDTFMVLLSQRRRWINSTIHNLMELLFVNDLCGTFCFSMQFVLFIDFIGCLALPAAITFTLYLIIMAILGKPAVISLILLALILGLPAVLIVMTSRKVVYVCWMLLYIISLPVWNFVLPMYAYWHFDDFSWGDTRKVEGEQKEGGHGDKEGEFDSTVFKMKRWNEFERERRTQYALDHQLPTPRFLERPRSEAFRDSMMLLRQTTPLPPRHGSVHSNESDWPLAKMAVVPAGMLDSPSPSPPPSQLQQQQQPAPPLHSSSSSSATSYFNGASTSPIIPVHNNNSNSANTSSNVPSKMRHELQEDMVEEVPLSDIHHSKNRPQDEENGTTD